MTEADVDRLVADQSIIRHRGKIESTINNARRAKALAGEFDTLGAYFWAFEPEQPPPLAATSPESTAMARSVPRGISS